MYTVRLRMLRGRFWRKDMISVQEREDRVAAIVHNVKLVRAAQFERSSSVRLETSSNAGGTS